MDTLLSLLIVVLIVIWAYFAVNPAQPMYRCAVLTLMAASMTSSVAFGYVWVGIPLNLLAGILIGLSKRALNKWLREVVENS